MPLRWFRNWEQDSKIADRKIADRKIEFRRNEDKKSRESTVGSRAGWFCQNYIAVSGSLNPVVEPRPVPYGKSDSAGRRRCSVFSVQKIAGDRRTAHGLGDSCRSCLPSGTFAVKRTVRNAQTIPVGYAVRRSLSTSPTRSVWGRSDRVQFRFAYMKCKDYAVFFVVLDLGSEALLMGEGLHSHDVRCLDFLLMRISRMRSSQRSEITSERNCSIDSALSLHQ